MKSNWSKVVGGVVAALLVPLSANAATYYVDPAGSDTAAGTSATTPFATIARAQTAAMPGDTVYIRKGTYAYTAGTTTCSSQTATINAIVLNKSGTAGNLIKYWAYPGEKPVFDFSGIKDSCRVKGFDVTGNYIHLKGLEVKGVPQNNNLNHESWGVWISGSNNIFEQLDLHNNMGPGLFIQNGGNNLVLNCDSHDNYDPMTSNGAGQSADGFGCHISAGNTGNVFRGCRAWWNSDDGWDFINAFEPCTVENSWSWYNGYLPGTTTSAPAGNGNGFKAGGYGTDTSTFPARVPQHIVRNCVSLLNKAAGFYANHHPGSSIFYNNTSYNNHPDFNMLGMSTSGADTTVGIYRNNIAFGSTLLSNNTHGTADDAFNSWSLSVTVSNADFGSVDLAGLDGPRQADGSLPNVANFHLVAGSDLIDKGTNVSLPYVGSAPDLGAFEFGAAVPDGGAGTTGTTGATGTTGTTGATSGTTGRTTGTGASTGAGRDAGATNGGTATNGGNASNGGATTGAASTTGVTSGADTTGANTTGGIASSDGDATSGGGTDTGLTSGLTTSGSTTAGGTATSGGQATSSGNVNSASASATGGGATSAGSTADSSSGDSGGCSCRTASSSPRGGNMGWPVSLGFIALALMRRRYGWRARARQGSLLALLLPVAGCSSANSADQGIDDSSSGGETSSASASSGGSNGSSSASASVGSNGGITGTSSGTATAGSSATGASATTTASGSIGSTGSASASDTAGATAGGTIGGATTGSSTTGGSGASATSTGGARDAGAGTTSGGATGSTGRRDGGAATTGSATGTTTGATGTATSSTTGGSGGCSGPVGTISGPLSTGVVFMDTAGQRVNAHGGGIIKVGDTFYMHGEFFSSTTTDNDFNGFSMYSSKDMATWKNEGIILPQQPSGELGPKRKGERPHIVKCPSTGEFVLYAHAASEDYQTDKEVVYATSATVNGQYAYKGPLKNSSGQIAAHSDMTAYADDSGAYVLTESGHVYTLAADCHSWTSDRSFSAVNGDSGGSESPTIFKAGSTYYWIGSNKTGWRANNNFYSTAPAVTGPWTYQGFIAPVTDPNNDLSDQRTWLSQSTWVQPVTGCQGTVYVYWGDHWDGNQDTTAPGRHNNLAGYVFQPFVFSGTKISLPTYETTWKLDVGAGTWTQ